MRRLLAVLFALLVSGTVQAEEMWAVRSVDALRWPDAKPVVFLMASGEKVEVVTRKDSMVRVRVKDSFGWVPQDALSATEPSALPEVPSPLGLPPMEPPIEP